MNAATSFQPQTPMLLKSRQDIEQEIQQRVAEERRRLKEKADQGRPRAPQFHRTAQDARIHYVARAVHRRFHGDHALYAFRPRRLRIHDAATV